jgi:polyhydroxybutyrate depolymerase
MIHKHFLLILIMTVCCFSASIFAQYDSISHGGYNRTYLLHLPDGYTGNDSLPLIVAMHGGTGSAYNLQNQSQLSVKANEENFIVVYPEGVKGGFLNVRSWNAGWCCGFASTSGVDDVGFIDALLDTLIEKYAIDTTRIYATGMSNGGFMTYRLACELSDRFAAVAPVAASMSVRDCTPSRAVPVIHFHSFQDTSVPYMGGIGDGISGHYNPPVDSVLNAWAAHNDCSVANDTLIDNNQYTLVKWTSCDNSSAIHYYITHDGGHSWPGGEQTPVGDPVSAYIDADDLMWAFFDQYSLNNEPTNIKDPQGNVSEIKVFPNPATGIVTLEIPESISDFTVTIYSASGNLVLQAENRKNIDLSLHPEGLYMIEIRSSVGIEKEKIIIHH